MSLGPLPSDVVPTYRAHAQRGDQSYGATQHEDAPFLQRVTQWQREKEKVAAARKAGGQVAHGVYRMMMQRLVNGSSLPSIWRKNCIQSNSFGPRCEAASCVVCAQTHY